MKGPRACERCPSISVGIMSAPPAARGCSRTRASSRWRWAEAHAQDRHQEEVAGQDLVVDLVLHPDKH
eukprot:5620717-Alexandrium_andersonii.AAC.1